MQQPWLTLDDHDLTGRRVLVRVDINVPIKDGRVIDATRIQAIRPTVAEILHRSGTVVLAAHLGRPKGQIVGDLSLAQLQPALVDALGQPVVLHADIAAGPTADLAPDSVHLLENLRFAPGETTNDPAFARQLAAWGDIFCNDAFAVSHRAHASTCGIAALLPSAAGRLLEKELAVLSDIMTAPPRPVAAIVGGAKISTKISLLASLTSLADVLFVGGGMANTFLLARGQAIGASLAEPDVVDEVHRIDALARTRTCEILLPHDVVCAETLVPNAMHTVRHAGDCPAHQMILDTGPASVARLSDKLAECRTVLWNGPIGAFETPPFNQGSTALARSIATLSQSGRLTSIAGGGETLAVIAGANAGAQFTHLSTGGGAFLAFLQGTALPGIQALDKC